MERRDAAAASFVRPMKVAVYLLVYLGMPVAASKVPNEAVRSVIGIVYIFLLIPFGILRAIDYYRTNDGTTWLSRVFNVLLNMLTGEPS